MRPQPVEKPHSPSPHRDSLPDVIEDFLARGFSFRYNTIKQVVEIKAVGTSEPFSELTERRLNSIILDAMRDGIKSPVGTIERIINSDFVPEFNPIRNYFEGLKWDGADHIAALARTVTVKRRPPVRGRDIGEIWGLFLRRWLIGLVACALSETQRNDLCLVLAGGQGKGKTTWLNRLVPPELAQYTFTGHITPNADNKDTATYLAEKLLVNVDDQFETILKTGFNTIKSIVTASHVTIRKPYQRLHQRRARIASFCGSVNEPHFLTDEENRRYLVIEAEHIHYGHSLDVSQAFAQAVVAWKNGERGYLAGEEREIQREINRDFQASSVEIDWLQKVFAPAGASDPTATWMQVGEILTHLQDQSRLKLSLRELKTALSVCGFAKPVSRRDERFSSPRYLIPLRKRSPEDDAQLSASIRNDIVNG